MQGLIQRIPVSMEPEGIVRKTEQRGESSRWAHRDLGSGVRRDDGKDARRMTTDAMAAERSSWCDQYHCKRDRL